MSVIEKLSTSLGRRDEKANQALARQIAAKKDKKVVKELIENLNHQDKGIQHDCIKVLYELGSIAPKLIAGYTKPFIALLDNKDNRLQWGAMTALNTLVDEVPDEIYKVLPKLIAVADKGSVITNDRLMAILIQLCKSTKYAKKAFPLLNERLLISPTNQLPMYAENTLPVVNSKNKALFIKTLNSRLGDIEKDTKRKRIEKVLKKIHSSQD